MAALVERPQCAQSAVPSVVRLTELGKTVGTASEPARLPPPTLTKISTGAELEVPLASSVATAVSRCGPAEMLLHERPKGLARLSPSLVWPSKNSTLFTVPSR